MAHDGTEAFGPDAHGATPTGDERPPASVSFGPYLLYRVSRRLERDGAAVQLGDRAFDILCTLIERAGEIVTHRELMVRVWGKVVVGEGSLRFQINALRKVLAQDGTQTQYIRNVTRRGYTFVAPLRKATFDFRARNIDGMRGSGPISNAQHVLWP
jgi:DNA-binding winged helix-turn-helix (wHTH) protein